MSEAFTSPPPFAPTSGNGSTTAVVESPSTAQQSTADIAKQEAGNVAAGATEAGQQVADTVKEQAKSVTAEAGKQAKDLLSQTQSELGEQAAVQQQRVASGLRSMAQELHTMADGSTEPGIATDLAKQAGDKAKQVAQWLDSRDPGTLLDEVRSFARQRPGTYLALALGAGVLTGRLTRGLTANHADASAASGAAAESTAPAVLPAPLAPELGSGFTTDFDSAAVTAAPVPAQALPTNRFDRPRGDGLS